MAPSAEDINSPANFSSLAMGESAIPGVAFTSELAPEEEAAIARARQEFGELGESAALAPEYLQEEQPAAAETTAQQPNVSPHRFAVAYTAERPQDPYTAELCRHAQVTSRFVAAWRKGQNPDAV